MNEKIERLFRFIKELMDNKKSVQVRLNFHEGDLSEKVEVKENLKLGFDPLIPNNWEEKIERDIESGTFGLIGGKKSPRFQKAIIKLNEVIISINEKELKQTGILKI